MGRGWGYTSKIEKLSKMHRIQQKKNWHKPAKEEALIYYNYFHWLFSKFLILLCLGLLKLRYYAEISISHSAMRNLSNKLFRILIQNNLYVSQEIYNANYSCITSLLIFFSLSYTIFNISQIKKCLFLWREKYRN